MYFQKNFSQNCDLKLTQFVLLMFIDLATKCSLTKVEYMNKSWDYAPPPPPPIVAINIYINLTIT